MVVGVGGQNGGQRSVSVGLSVLVKSPGGIVKIPVGESGFGGRLKDATWWNCERRRPSWWEGMEEPVGQVKETADLLDPPPGRHVGANPCGANCCGDTGLGLVSGVGIS